MKLKNIKSDYYTNHKTFIKAYNLLSKDHRKFKSYYSDKRLTNSEKLLLKALYGLKKGDADCLENIKTIRGLNPFLQGYKYVIQAAYYNNSMKLMKAIACAKKAISALESIQDQDFIFNPMSQIVIAYGNLKDSKEMGEYLEKLDKLPKDTDYKSGLYLQCKGFYELINGGPEKTVDSIGECIANYKNAVSDRLSFIYVVLFMAYVQLDKPDECFAVLQEYKKAGGFKVKANYKYMVTMLNYIYNGSPIYCYKRDFINVLTLYYELEVIKHIAKEDYEQAMVAWTFLNERNPKVYKADFKFKGPVCLFSRALDSLPIEMPGRGNEQIDLSDLNNYKSYQAKLEYILKQSKTPLEADHLVALLWGELADYDAIVRLRTQVSRLRSKKKLDIQFKNGAYYLAS